MFRRLIEGLASWYRDRNYRSSRERSSCRASSTAQRLINSGALQNGRMTGDPLARR